jgi:hypothetical protein
MVLLTRVSLLTKRKRKELVVPSDIEWLVKNLGDLYKWKHILLIVNSHFHSKCAHMLIKVDSKDREFNYLKTKTTYLTFRTFDLMALPSILHFLPTNFETSKSSLIFSSKPCKLMPSCSFAYRHDHRLYLAMS